MATTSMDITSFVGKLLEQDDVDALREGVRVLAQAVMETEVSSQIGAAPYERSTERTAYRNGYRTRRWDTRVGTIELKIPKVTAGVYFPSLLEPRRRAEKALHAVVVEAYVKGVSTRKVDDLVKALGIDGISRSEVSRICKVLDDEVRTFLGRPIEPSCPYLWLDATFHKVREAGRVISVATVVAIGVTEQGERTVLGAATGASEDHQFWTSFLRQLVKRGLRGVRLVISDAHEGLRTAIAKVLHEAAWQRCRVHFMRNVLSVVPKQAQDAVAAIVRTIFAQPDHASAMTSSTRSPGCSVRSSPRWPSSWRMPPRTCLPISTSPVSTAAGSTRRTRWSDYTKRSSAARARRRDLPHARLPDADGRDAACRAGRREAGLRPPVLQRGVDGEGGCPRGR
jgi:transposase-like protein